MDYVGTHELIMPALIVPIEQDPQKTQQEDQPRYRLSDYLSDEHCEEGRIVAVLFDYSHAKKLFPRGGSPCEENERPNNIRDKQKDAKENT